MRRRSAKEGEGILTYAYGSTDRRPSLLLAALIATRTVDEFLEKRVNISELVSSQRLSRCVLWTQSIVLPKLSWSDPNR